MEESLINSNFSLLVPNGTAFNLVMSVGCTKPRRQRQRGVTELMSTAMAVYGHYNSWYIVIVLTVINSLETVDSDKQSK